MRSDGSDVFVRSFPEGSGRWKISGQRIAHDPRWRRDGKELFYLEGLSANTSVMAVPVQDGTHKDLQAGPPRALFQSYIVVPFPEATVFAYSPNSDGQRFLVILTAVEGQPSINVITNWEKVALGNK